MQLRFGYKDEGVRRKKFVSRLIEGERTYVRNFVFEDGATKDNLSPRIADVIYQHVEEKISC